MATYRIMGRRWLRKYTAPQISPVYAASVDARMIVESLCDVPWTRVFQKDARMTYHTDEAITEEPKITGLDMNVIIRDDFDAALFCADHHGGQHRAFANVACYRYTMPDSAIGKSISALDIQVTSDPYNSNGVRLHTFTNATGEIPMNCHVLRGEDAGGEIIDDGTTAAGVAPRTTETRGNTEYWYPTMTTVRLSPSGGMTLQRYLFIVVALESYSTVRGNWLEGSSFITNDVSINISAPVEDWSADEVNDLSDADGLFEIPVVKHGTTQSNFSEVTGMCSVAVLSNGDDFNGAFDSEGQRRYNLTPYQKQLYAPETYDADPARFYIGLRTLYAKFYAGEMELAKYPTNELLRPGAGFSARPRTWTINDADGVGVQVEGWSISASMTALAFSAPTSLSVIKMKLDWGATGSNTRGVVNGGHYNFWLKRGAYVNTLPESLVKNPDIYMADKKEVDGWEYLGNSTGDSLEVELSTPLNSEHATVLVTAFADQKSEMSKLFTDGYAPWGASTRFDVLPSAVNSDFTVNTGTAIDLNALMTPDITLYGVGSEESADNPLCLCFTAKQAGSTVSMSHGADAPDVSLVTSTDGGNTWASFVPGQTTVTLANAGDKVYFMADYGGNTAFSSGLSAALCNTFTMTGRLAASGDIMSLITRDFASLSNASLSANAFCGLFRDCTALTAAPALPATTLATNCYRFMFRGCTALAAAPALPATTLAVNCYYEMFLGCTALAAAPALPATTMADYCYTSMFYNCTSLTAAPALPATTLAEHCYGSMFYNCTSLTAAPALPATTLAAGCYGAMFESCTALTAAPALPATTPAASCYGYMFHGCTALAAAPALPATTLAFNCYYYMFQGCTALNNVTTHQTTFDTSQDGWLTDVAATGTFYCPSALGTNATITRGTSACPAGWTVVNI